MQHSKEVEAMIGRLSEMADLIGLRTHIIEGTDETRRLGPDPWGNTRDYMQKYANPANTEPLIEVFQEAGCQNEVEAVRWLLRHDKLVP